MNIGCDELCQRIEKIEKRLPAAGLRVLYVWEMLDGGLLPLLPRGSSAP